MTTIDITRNSDLSGLVSTRTVEVHDPAKLLLFIQDRTQFGHIQNEFPELSADDREFILTGITPEEWDEAMGGE